MHDYVSRFANVVEVLRKFFCSNRVNRARQRSQLIEVFPSERSEFCWRDVCGPEGNECGTATAVRFKCVIPVIVVAEALH